MSEPHREAGLVRRRSLVAGLAWCSPVIAVAAAAPLQAASGCSIALTTTGVGGLGFDLNLRDGKNQVLGSPTLSNTGVMPVTLTYTCGGVPVSGASITVAGDSTTDSEGNFMIGFWDTSAPVGTFMNESPAQATVALTTNAAGQVTTRVSTATYGKGDCYLVTPPSTYSVTKTGLWTVIAPGATQTFTYRVYDGGTGSALVTCP